MLGPLPRLAVALDAATKETYDVGVLDINLGGELVYPLAEILTDRKVPLLFLTGYSGQAISPDYADRPCIGKPVKPQQLISAILDLV